MTTSLLRGARKKHATTTAPTDTSPAFLRSLDPGASLGFADTIIRADSSVDLRRMQRLYMVILKMWSVKRRDQNMRHESSHKLGCGDPWIRHKTARETIDTHRILFCLRDCNYRSSFGRTDCILHKVYIVGSVGTIEG